MAGINREDLSNFTVFLQWFHSLCDYLLCNGVDAVICSFRNSITSISASSWRPGESGGGNEEGCQWAWHWSHWPDFSSSRLAINLWSTGFSTWSYKDFFNLTNISDMHRVFIFVTLLCFKFIDLVFGKLKYFEVLILVTESWLFCIFFCWSVKFVLLDWV